MRAHRIRSVFMTISDICNRNVATVQGDASLKTAAELMREAHIGDLIVTEHRGARIVPIGILTDRDIIIEVLAENVDPKVLRVADVMSTDLATVRDDNGLEFALNVMRGHGVRRLPVLDRDGALTGVVSLDDIIQYLARLASAIGSTLEVEQFQETKRRP
jgi:predicted transcriptional regulator